MIQKIVSIKAFGVFENFQWPASLPCFKRFNLIYGWNYSGKTTLSRIFRCFELRQMHLDFQTAQVRLESQDGTGHALANLQTAPFFRVFNSDFIRENLKLEDGDAAPILILAAENIAKQAELTKKTTEREQLALDKDANDKKRRDKETAIDQALTRYARDHIKNPLAEVNYDKRQFEPKVKACCGAPTKHLLDDAAVTQYVAVCRSTDKKPALSATEASLSSVVELKEQCSTLLARTVTASVRIPRLAENAVLEAWANDGRSLHEGKDVCQFCGQPLPHDLLSQLGGHFSAEYDGLISDLKTLAATIASAREETIALDDKAAFYSELSGDLVAAKGQLDEAIKTRAVALNTLTLAVADKQTKAFTTMGCPPIDDPSEQITAAVTAINAVITKHNTRTTEFDKNRRDAFAKLEMHYAASFVRDEKYNEELAAVANLKKTVKEQEGKLSALDGEIRQLDQELSEASKGAERINQLLAAYFGRDDLRVMVSPAERYQIVRRDAVAKNLSEGEKTAIAFAYFITLVQDGRHPLDDTRIVIDDPISSLDANHLFNTYALIKTQLAGCKQLFISTHSFEFYNLIREWATDDKEDVNKPQKDWKKWGIFLIERADDGKAEIKEIPGALVKFKSEYHYLFSLLYAFDKSGDADFDRLLSLPNVVRRFMEAFGGIMIPMSQQLRKKMERLFPDEVQRERVLKFINHYSHNQTVTRSLVIPDLSECKAVVRSCLDAVNTWDADYFRDLEAEIAPLVAAAQQG